MVFNGYLQNETLATIADYLSKVPRNEQFFTSFSNMAIQLNSLTYSGRTLLSLGPATRSGLSVKILRVNGMTGNFFAAALVL